MKKATSNQIAGCQGKIAYADPYRALKTVLRQRKRGYAVKPYRCSLCAKWHVGRIDRAPKAMQQ